MSEEKTIGKTNSVRTPENEPVYVPRVDIREDAERFTIVADLPGADEKSVEAAVQNRVLTIEGWTRSDRPDDRELLGREFVGGRYRRDFTLSDAVDPDRIQARVKNGVLTVVIPKKEEVKARKIQVAG
jgi:HSP20 family protein